MIGFLKHVFKDRPYHTRVGQMSADELHRHQMRKIKRFKKLKRRARNWKTFNGI